MLGAIIGDVVGSTYEFNKTKEMNFPLFPEKSKFTDDTVLTIATAKALVEGRKDYDVLYKKYANDYMECGWGARFAEWAKAPEMQPAYNSWGNGSAMRVAPIGYLFDDIETTIDEARLSAEVTHNHPEGIKGAEAIAASIFLALHGDTKEQIRDYIEDRFDYDLRRTIEEIRPTYKFEVSCQSSVPEAIIAFLDSDRYETAIRLAISLGGDADTLACMAGGLAEAFYTQVPVMMIEKTWDLLPEEFHKVIIDFYKIVDARQSK
jgi:ADP-ribosylglycohydrolase